jgi:hypothetical protein
MRKTMCGRFCRCRIEADPESWDASLTGAPATDVERAFAAKLEGLRASIGRKPAP